MYLSLKTNLFKTCQKQKSDNALISSINALACSLIGLCFGFGFSEKFREILISHFPTVFFLSKKTFRNTTKRKKKNYRIAGLNFS